MLDIINSNVSHDLHLYYLIDISYTLYQFIYYSLYLLEFYKKHSRSYIVSLHTMYVVVYCWFIREFGIRWKVLTVLYIIFKTKSNGIVGSKYTSKAHGSSLG